MATETRARPSRPFTLHDATEAALRTIHGALKRDDIDPARVRHTVSGLVERSRVLDFVEMQAARRVIEEERAKQPTLPSLQKEMPEEARQIFARLHWEETPWYKKLAIKGTRWVKAKYNSYANSHKKT